VGCSRRLPWIRRPRAAALLAAAAEGWAGFDAIVVGEYERAYFGEQFPQLARCLDGTGAVWLPEAGGPVDVRGAGASGPDGDLRANHGSGRFCGRAIVCSLMRSLDQTRHADRVGDRRGQGRGQRRFEWVCRGPCSACACPVSFIVSVLRVLGRISDGPPTRERNDLA